MIIKDIHFNGFDITSSRFVERDESDTDGGRFNVDYKGLNFSSLQENEGNHEFFLDTTAILKAYNGEATEDYSDENLAFECEVSFSMRFKYLSEKGIEESDIEKNLWFFENYLFLSGKLALESVLRHTVIDTITFPWHRKIN
ncbi:hypothetical protein ACUU8A_000369 [Enterobacter hormaechei]|uniref:hypothetical protein n=1 Tax=Enterobacter hormaechei TaxID=158836 RepID=UPI00330AB0EF